MPVPIVVLPNMDAPRSGARFEVIDGDSIIPQVAPAHCVKSLILMRFRPQTSTIVGNITISFVPTYSLTSPPDIVENITLGTPTGRERIAAVAIAVPAPPPNPRIASIFLAA